MLMMSIISVRDVSDRSILLQATRQMEERMKSFINENKHIESDDLDALPIVRFVHHQVVEIARDCLKKSEEKLITRRYFYEMSESLERLLVEVRHCI